MSARTTEQLVSDRMRERIKAEANPNTTVIVDESLDAGFTARQDTINTELGADSAFTSRKVTAVPTTFDSNDQAIVLASSEPFLTESGIKDKLRLAVDVKFLICWHSFFKDDEFENFELILNENIVKPGTFAKGERIEYPLKIYQRRKVFV